MEFQEVSPLNRDFEREKEPFLLPESGFNEWMALFYGWREEARMKHGARERRGIG